MIKSLPLYCPSCQSGLKVKNLYCENCDTTVSGLFSLPVLASLSSDDQKFIIEFIKCSGSLKDMAQKMSLSYPTVRNMLDGIIEKIQKNEQQPL